MKAEIAVLQGDRKGDVFTIRLGQTLLFGREAQCDVQVFDEGVSRRHFVIESRADHFVVLDMESANGTYINGVRVQEQELRSGDVIRAGNCYFSFHYVGSKNSPNTTAVQFSESQFEGLVPAVAKKFTIRQLGTEVEEDTQAARHLESLKALYEIGNVIHGQQDINSVFDAIMDQVLRVVSADRGYLMMYHPEDASFEPKVVRRTDTVAAESGLTVSRTVMMECVNTGNSLLSSDIAADDRFKDGQSIIANNIRSVICVPLQTPDQTLGVLYLDNLGEGSEGRLFTEYDLMLASAIGRQAGLAIHRAKLFEELDAMFFGTIRALVATIEANDEYTHGHSERVTEFSLAIAQAMDFDAESLDHLRRSAILHDIGKIAISENVLNKPGALTEEEFAQIKAHPVLGAKILRHIKGADAILPGVMWHHEKWNGRGYPDGLKGEDIPLQARIIAVADAFDAMTSSRPYRSNMELEEVIEEFERCKDDHFDGRIVDVFVQLLRSGVIKPHSTSMADRDQDGVQRLTV